MKHILKAINEEEISINRKEILSVLGDASDFASLAIELLRSKKKERAEEAIFKAVTKIEDARTKLNGGK